MVTTGGGPQGKYQPTAEGQVLNGLDLAYPNRNTTLAHLLTLFAQLQSPPMLVVS